MARKKYSTGLTKKQIFWWQNHFNKADIPELEEWKVEFETLQAKKCDIIKRYCVKS